MSIFSAAVDLVGDVGFGVIKNSGRLIFGTSKALLGVVTEDEDLIAEGIEGIGSGALGLGGAILRENVLGDNSDDDSLDIGNE
jgi:hypothetical protein